MSKPEEQEVVTTHFIREIIREDQAAGKNEGQVVTRFPPEPNGFLHIGHAKSICLNFDMGSEFGGRTNLRFDDTNPEKEESKFIDAIQRDVQWLGYSWGDKHFFASNYFDKLYGFAVELIEADKAYVCSLNGEQMREYRGTLTEPGKDSPDRDRPVEENLDLFSRMRTGEFPDGTYVLRAKIDMAHPNINMRDPVMYRIRHVHHHQVGDLSLYPSYDWTHGISDALEGVTHSLCTLEFADHKILYDWFLDNISINCHPQQIEFARLELDYTVTSKRKLAQLVNEGHVSGWDDPRMPTISGMRRRGYPPEAIHDFCNRIGVTRKNSHVDYTLLETCVRDHLNTTAKRTMAVLNPIKVVIENYPEGEGEIIDAPYFPDDRENSPTRPVPFSREIYIERDDFMEVPARKYFRLAPGKEVRLRFAYYITCTDVIKDENGEITELRATYDPATKGGWSDDGRKVKGTLHWVSAQHAVEAEVRLYNRLFTEANPTGQEDKEFTEFLNPESVQVITAKLEPSLANTPFGEGIQFERKAFFCRDKADGKESAADAPLVFNRIVELRDSWAKIKAKQ